MISSETAATSGELRPLAILVERLVKRFDGVNVVDGLSFDVAVGECVALLGPNGAGKTTTVEILEGLQEATSGEVRLFGKSWNEDGLSLRAKLGVQLQDTRFPERLTVVEVVRLFRSFCETGLSVDEALALVKLESRRGARVQHLSGGQLQRLALAVAMISSPALLFLDEPTTGLDPQSRRSLWDLILELKRRGHTIVLTTHYLEEAERLCDRVVIIDHGKVIATGSPPELISRLPGATLIDVQTDPPLNSALLAGLPDVLEVRQTGATITLAVKRLHVALPALVAALAERSVTLTDLATRRATLDDVFLALTGRSLREAADPKEKSDDEPDALAGKAEASP